MRSVLPLLTLFVDCMISFFEQTLLDPIHPNALQTVRVALQLSAAEPTMKRQLDAAAMMVQMTARSMRQNMQKDMIDILALDFANNALLGYSVANYLGGTFWRHVKVTRRGLLYSCPS